MFETPKGITKPKDGSKNATTVNEGVEPSEAPLPTSTASELPDVDEVWFAGCHCDVGGGATADSYSLSEITLRWMVKQVNDSKCGIKFDPAALKRAEIDDSTDTLTAPAKPIIEPALEPDARLSSLTHGEDGYEEDMVRKGEKRDAEAPPWPRKQDVSAGIHDVLASRRAWWTWEIVPTTFVWHVNRKWNTKWG